MDNNYNVVFTGAVAEGVSRASAIEAFARFAKISQAQAEGLFAKAPTVVKRGVSREVAEAYCQRLQALGLVVEVQLAGQPAVSASAQEPAGSAAGSTGGSGIAAGGVAGAGGEAAAGKRAVGFVFSGNGYEYFKIWIVNILLTIITIGIYAPWAKVRNLQYFYGNTSLDGQSFLFTGNPVKMLIGRLIAIAILLVVTVAGNISPGIAVLIALALVFVFPWVMNRTLAFYARNSKYRNIRFRFTGTYGRALEVFLLWPLLAALTFGLLSPYAIYKQQQYRAQKHHYGNKAFAFSAGAGDYYAFCLLAFGIVILGAFVGGILGAVIHPVAGIIGAMAGYGLGILYFMVNMNNVFLNHLSLSAHDFRANYEIPSFGWLMVSNFLLTVITLGIFIPWAKVRVANYAAEHTVVDVTGDLDDFARISQPDESAFGEEFGDVFDMDVAF